MPDIVSTKPEPVDLKEAKENAHPPELTRDGDIGPPTLVKDEDAGAVNLVKREAKKEDGEEEEEKPKKKEEEASEETEEEVPPSLSKEVTIKKDEEVSRGVLVRGHFNECSWQTASIDEEAGYPCDMALDMSANGIMAQAWNHPAVQWPKVCPGCVFSVSLYLIIS
jgi:hypothetical protein